MSNFLFILSVCFFAIQQETTAQSVACNTQKLGPKQPLLITIFDKNYESDKGLWPNLCEVIKQFPQGLITMEYRPGATATGTKDNIKCGSGTCKVDQYHGCELFHYKFVNDCFREAEGASAALIATVNCYCKQESNQLLLDNAALRASWKVPESVIPALAFNQQYDPCAQTGKIEEIKHYLCEVYQRKVGPC